MNKQDKIKKVMREFKESGQLHEAYKEQIQSTLESDNLWIGMIMKSIGADHTINNGMTDEAIDNMIDSMLREQFSLHWYSLVIILR